MKKEPKLTLKKFKIAKLQNPGLIFGGTGERTGPQDPECNAQQVTNGTNCETGGNG